MTTLEIANAIREARKAKGITQEQLAVAVGVTKPTINLFENNKQNITIDLLCRICTELDVRLTFHTDEWNNTVAEIIRLSKTL